MKKDALPTHMQWFVSVLAVFIHLVYYGIHFFTRVFTLAPLQTSQLTALSD
jgi:hypothetical protein